MKPGPELDMQVAKAIGFDVRHGKFCQPVCQWDWIEFDGYYTAKPPEFFSDNIGCQDLSDPPVQLGTGIRKFSTDLNDAFWAADQIVGNGPGFRVNRIELLIGDHDYGTGCVCTLILETFKDDGNRDDWLELAEAFDEHTALAICAAILKLKETE